MWDGDGPTPPGQFFLIIQLCEESVTLTLTNPPSLTFWWNYSNFLKIISSEPLNVLMMIFKWEPFNGKYFSVERSCCIYFESLRSPHWVLLGDFLGVSVPSFQECAMWCVVTNITHDALPPSLPPSLLGIRNIPWGKGCCHRLWGWAWWWYTYTLIFYKYSYLSLLENVLFPCF